MKVLIIDNYDSFTFNLYQYVGELLVGNGLKPFPTCLAGRREPFPTVDVVRNDVITGQEIKNRKYDRIIISPGPGDPADRNYFGVCAEVLTDIGKKTPVLGVCLGMQGMAHYYGGKIVQAKVPMHGKTSVIKHNQKGLFTHLPQDLEVMRYHSLIAEKKSLPECLEVTATAIETNEIMGLKHKEFPIEGIQFHPESFATEGGIILLGNFLSLVHSVFMNVPWGEDNRVSP